MKEEEEEGEEEEEEGRNSKLREISYLANSHKAQSSSYLSGSKGGALLW